ncbi:MAG: hypothetical protein CVV30_08565 [Methanomicrobiales archaeon HGW-Methanomicrobiales-1]|jgi:hypothetical protein|nr:MAG: hypothetical protein CVV30_08565 [Methanomicrobiales archaeon HGW-Methanomicrobiales-1]
MSSHALLFWFVILTTLLLVAVPGVSGWTLQSWSTTPSGSELPPGTPVTAAYSIHFDSWATGSTFDQGNTLTMYTDLTNPHWVVKKIETLEDQPSVIEEIPVRQSAQVRLDSWTLSYSSKRFDINVELTGTTPATDQSRDISVVKLQQLTSSATPVSGTLINKKIQVLVPTPEPTVTTSTPTIDATPAENIEVTMVPMVQETPTKKVTYSPGPEPLLIAGLLAGLVCVMAMLRRK